MGSCYSTIAIAIGKKSSEDAAIDTSTTASRRWRKGRDSLLLEKTSADSDDAQLHQISARVFTNASTTTACLYTQQGKKGTNQDAMLVWENFSSSDTTFCGVFDGHGPYGHMVSKKVRDSLPLILCSQWKANDSGDQNSLRDTSSNSEETAALSMDDECFESLDSEENEKHPEMYLPLKNSLLKSFKLMDKELKLHPTLDCFCSGSTAVTLVKQGQDLVIGNVGDSRAVLAMRDKDNSLVAIQLTVDLKPDLPKEAARIQQCKGRVFALQDEPEVARVWLPNNDSPGLAMARAFGDFCLKDFGLISVPDIYYRHLTERDEFIILATDGVWDVLSNKEAVDIVASAPSQATAARALVDCAVRSWRLKYPTSKNDDCAVVCLFLEHLPTVSGSTEEDGATKTPDERLERMVVTSNENGSLATNDDAHAFIVENSRSVRDCDEIVPISESMEDKSSGKSQSPSKRSLAECIFAAEDEEWSALEGVTRVNSLLSLPRFLSGDKRSASWRKWL
ncbi:hypothetical protein LWI29_032569 [Acer saccharum]|uniref:protein-serine/threonine phosphatase n=1 Tax=Acer saccharum TaxID=4024 RepID=A0AA39TAG1_ACESA|nr:hypothetical protein LWI29_032569 [Acer saccharum]